MKTLKGDGIGGVGQGEVHQVYNSTSLKQFTKGQILVTDHTTPDMFDAMIIAGGIVTDRGGAGSHAAIVARYHRIPCVVGAKTATLDLMSGQSVTVDGELGEVRIMESNQEVWDDAVKRGKAKMRSGD